MSYNNNPSNINVLPELVEKELTPKRKGITKNDNAMSFSNANPILHPTGNSSSSSSSKSSSSSSFGANPDSNQQPTTQSKQHKSGRPLLRVMWAGGTRICTPDSDVDSTSGGKYFSTRRMKEIQFIRGLTQGNQCSNSYRLNLLEKQYVAINKITAMLTEQKEMIDLSKTKLDECQIRLQKSIKKLDESTRDNAILQNRIIEQEALLTASPDALSIQLGTTLEELSKVKNENDIFKVKNKNVSQQVKRKKIKLGELKDDIEEQVFAHPAYSNQVLVEDWREADNSELLLKKILDEIKFFLSSDESSIKIIDNMYKNLQNKVKTYLLRNDEFLGLWTLYSHLKLIDEFPQLALITRATAEEKDVSFLSNAAYREKHKLELTPEAIKFINKYIETLGKFPIFSTKMISVSLPFMQEYQWSLQRQRRYLQFLNSLIVIIIMKIIMVKKMMKRKNGMIVLHHLMMKMMI